MTELKTKKLRAPRIHPPKWELGDLAIKYITLRSDDDPDPPCVLVMVTNEVDGKCECNHLDCNQTEMIDPKQLLGVDEALYQFERLSDDMTIRYYREGKRKIELLAGPISPPPKWVELVKWWDAYPEHQPDGFPVMKNMILENP